MTVNKTAVSMAMAFFLFFYFGASGVIGKYAEVGFFQKLTPVAPTDTDKAIEEAFQKSVQQNRNQVLGFQVYDVVIDHIQYAQDKTTALVWIALREFRDWRNYRLGTWAGPRAQ